MIRYKNLTKSYGTEQGIFDFSFEVEEGEIFGLIGPEGAGKTTALRMLMGFEQATKGRCAINGKDCAEDSLSLHHLIGYLPPAVKLPKELTARQFLRSIAQMRRLKNLGRVFDMATRFDLNVDQKISMMSDADVKKTGVICALMHSPQIILLDEPFRDLDARTRSELIDVLLEEKERGRMILLTSESVECIDLTCDRVAMLDKGNVIYLGDIENLRENMRRDYMIQFSNALAALQFSKEKKYEIKSMKDRNVVVNLKGELSPLLRTLTQYEVSGFEPVPLSLQETFEHFYGGRLHV